MKAKLVVNPEAGQGKSQRYIGKILKRLNSHISSDLTITKNVEEAFAIAENLDHDKYDSIITAGGDGLLNTVINGLLKSPVQNSTCLGYIPLGMSNVAAWELGIPQDPCQACDVILNGKTSKIDLGRVTEPFDRYFISMVDFGFPAYIVHLIETKPFLKRLLGKTGYKLMGLLRLIDFAPPKLKINIDDKRVESDGLFIVISNGKFYGGEYIMSPGSSVTDGKLELCVFKNKKRREFLHFVSHFLNQEPDGEYICKEHQYNDFLEFFSGERIEIDSTNEVWGQIDGEPLGKLPVKIETAPQMISMYTP